jgi:thioredoxin 1
MKIILQLLLFSFLLPAFGQEYKQLEPAEFQKKLTSVPDPQLIDVRTAEEYSEKSIQNSLNIDINRSDFQQIVSQLIKTKPVFLYCFSGSRSSNAASLLLKLGFTQIYELKGGILKWEKASFPVNKSVSHKKGKITAEDFASMVSGSGYTLIDFNASWCAPCKKLLPVLENFEKSNPGIKVIFIDADSNSELCSKNAVDSYPTLQIFKGGKVIARHEGYTDEAGLKKWVEEVVSMK